MRLAGFVVPLLLAILSGCSSVPARSDASLVSRVASQNVPVSGTRVEPRSKRPGFWKRHPVLTYTLIAMGVATVVYLIRRGGSGGSDDDAGIGGCYLRERETGVYVPPESNCQSDQNNTNWLRCCPG